MALRDTFADAVTTILDAFGDLIPDVEYHRVVLGDYNPTTGVVAKTDTTITTRGAMYQEKEASKDWSKPNEDSKRLLIAGDELGVQPQAQQDYVVLGGITYEIQRFDTIPGDVAYILYIRAP